MTRRRIELLVTLVLGLLMVPLLAEVQTPPKIPRLGILEDAPNWGAFRQGLRDLGYVESQNIALEWRVAEGNPDRLAEAAAELVRLPVDILVAFGTPATRAAKEATTRIPIVMVSGGDPLRAPGSWRASPGRAGTSPARVPGARTSARNRCRCCAKACPPSGAWRSSGTRLI
jgi:ABC transporter substrate binding protein